MPYWSQRNLSLLLRRCSSVLKDMTLVLEIISINVLTYGKQPVQPYQEGAGLRIG